VVVVLDSCIDDTADVVSRYSGVEVAHGTERSVGVAREIGARRLLDSTAAPRSELWLANTDADSRVPANWLSTMVKEADRGAHVVLGTVLPDATSAVARRWRSRHVLRDGHPHVHGANLGIRGDVHNELGGWPPLRTGEDVALAQRATAADHLRIARIGTIPVTTSARTEGRAPRGFAAYLHALALEAG
jgi:hypothetical protein